MEPEIENVVKEAAGNKALLDRILEALAASETYDTFRYRMIHGVTYIETPDDAIPLDAEGYIIYYTNNFDKEDFVRNDDGTAAILNNRDEADLFLRKAEEQCAILGGSNFRIRNL